MTKESIAESIIKSDFTLPELAGWKHNLAKQLKSGNVVYLKKAHDLVLSICKYTENFTENSKQITLREFFYFCHNDRREHLLERSAIVDHEVEVFWDKYKEHQPVYPIGPEAAINTTEKIFHLKITEKNINDKGFVDAMKVDIYLIQLRELKKITDEVWKWQCDFYIP